MDGTKIYSKGTSRFRTTDKFSRSENCEKGYEIPNSYSSSRETGSNIAILGHKRATRTPVCNIFSKFLNKRSQIVLWKAIVEALMENMKVKNCVLYRANCFVHKIDGLEHRNKMYN